MQQLAFVTGGIFGFTAIILGAFGSHLLKKRWSSELLHSFEIGVKYQIYHALFLILIGVSAPFDTTFSKLSVLFSIFGILLFSGSIYGICIVKSNNGTVKLLGPITPLGGLCLLLSWLFYTIAMIS